MPAALGIEVGRSAEHDTRDAVEKGNAIIPLVNDFLDAKKREEAI